VVYAPGIKYPIATDYVLVACCRRIGTYLVMARRLHKKKMTEKRFSVMWDDIPEYPGNYIGGLCSYNRRNDPPMEVMMVRNLLVEIDILLIILKDRDSNHIFLDLLDYGDKLPTED
jgi:hypothetical protein